MSLGFVITSINSPTSGIQAIANRAQQSGFLVIVVGDRKTPGDWQCEGVQFLSVELQEKLPYALTKLLPWNTYARKMLGYLAAFGEGATWVRETDDDNHPYDAFFEEPSVGTVCRIPLNTHDWLNVYTLFTHRNIWPRGYPLDLVGASFHGEDVQFVESMSRGTLVFQALADGDPDVDAIYRLVAPDTSSVTFERRMPVALPAGTWSPFNSQATTWPRSLLPLMYLPSTCSFRMTDIWRSYVAQRLMPSLEATLVVTPATVFQERNEHDLMRDFEQEIEGYVGYTAIRKVLTEVDVHGGEESLLADLEMCYAALVEHGFLDSKEMTILEAWVDDVERVWP